MLEAKNITMRYPVQGTAGIFRRRTWTVLSDVSLGIFPGRTLGLVGESGTGKSTLARILCALQKPDAGELYFENRSFRDFSQAEWRRFRRNVQMIFQDPASSLNPCHTVEESLKEPFVIHPESRPENLRQRLCELLDEVGLGIGFLKRYPRELSGGERQRVSIARAVALKPKLLICDEPVSSLDVIIQAEILNLLLRLQNEHGLSYFFISHDLRIIRHMSDQIAVLEGGRIAESGETQAVLQNPKSPVTRKLLADTDLSDL